MHVYACYKHIQLIVQSQKNTSFMQENIFEIQTRAESKRKATWRESHETGSNRGALKQAYTHPSYYADLTPEETRVPETWRHVCYGTGLNPSFLSTGENAWDLSKRCATPEPEEV